MKQTMASGGSSTQTFRDRVFVGEVHAHTVDSRLMRDEAGQEMGMTLHVPMTKRFTVSTDGSDLLSVGRMVDVPGEAMPQDVLDIGSDTMPMNLVVHGADEFGNPTTFRIDRGGEVHVRGKLNVEGGIEQSSGAGGRYEATSGKAWEFDGASGDVANGGNMSVGTAGPGEDLKRQLSVYNAVAVGAPGTVNDMGRLSVFGNGTDFVVDGAAPGGMEVTLGGSLAVQGDALRVEKDGDVVMRPGAGAGELSVEAATVEVDATGDVSFVGPGEVRVGQNAIGQGKNVTFFSRAEVVGGGATFEERHLAFNGATGQVTAGGLVVAQRGLAVQGGALTAANLTSLSVQAASATVDAPEVVLTGNVRIGVPGQGRTLAFPAEGGRDTSRTHLGDWTVAGHVAMTQGTTLSTMGAFALGTTEERGGNFTVLAQDVTLSSSPGSRTILRGGGIDLGLQTAPVNVVMHGPNPAEDVTFTPDVSGNSLLHVGGRLRADKDAAFHGASFLTDAHLISVGAAGTASVTLGGDLVVSTAPLKVGTEGAGRDVTFVSGTTELPTGFTFSGADNSGHAHFRGPLTVGGATTLSGGIFHSSPAQPVTVDAQAVSLTSAGAIYLTAAEPMALQGGANFVATGGTHANVTVHGETGKVTVGTGGLEVGGPVSLDSGSALEKLGKTHPVTLEGSTVTIASLAGEDRIRLRGGRVEVGQAGHGGSTGLSVYGWATTQRNFTVASDGRVTINNQATVNHGLAVNAPAEAATFACQSFSVTTSAGAVTLDTQGLVVGNGVGAEFEVHGVQAGEKLSFDRDSSDLSVTGAVHAGRGLTSAGPLAVSATAPGQNATITANAITLASSSGGNIDVRGGHVRLFADNGMPDAGGRLLTLRAASGANNMAWNGANGSLTVGGAVGVSGPLTVAGAVTLTGGSSDASLSGRMLTANYASGMRMQGSKFTFGPAVGRNTHEFEIRGNTTSSQSSLIFAPGLEGQANGSQLTMHGGLAVHGPAVFNSALTVQAGTGTAAVTAERIELNAGNPAEGGELLIQRTNVTFGNASAGMGTVNFHAPDAKGATFDGETGAWTFRGRVNTATQASLFSERLRMWVDGNGLTRATFANVDAFDVTVNPGRTLTLAGNVLVGEANSTVTLVAASPDRQAVFSCADGSLAAGGDLTLARNLTMATAASRFTFANASEAGMFSVAAHEATFDVASRMSILSSTGASPELHIGSASHGGIALVAHASSGPNMTFNPEDGTLSAARFVAAQGLTNAAGAVALTSTVGALALTSATGDVVASAPGGKVAVRASAVAFGGDGQGGGERTAWNMRWNAAADSKDLTWSAATGAMTLRGALQVNGDISVAGGLAVNDATRAVTVTAQSVGITSTAPVQLNANLHVGANGQGRSVEMRSTVGKHLVFDGATGIVRSGGMLLVNHMPGSAPASTLLSVQGTVGTFSVATSGHVTAPNVECSALTTSGGANIGGSATVGSMLTVQGVGATGYSFNLDSGNARIGGDLYVAGTLTAENTTNTTVENVLFENHMLVVNVQEQEADQTATSAHGGGIRVLGGATDTEPHLHKDLRFARGGSSNLHPDDSPYPDYDADVNAAAWQSNQHLVLGSRRGLVFSPGGNQVATTTADAVQYVSATDEVTASGEEFVRFNLASFNALEPEGGTLQNIKAFMPGTRVNIPGMGAKTVASTQLGERVFVGEVAFSTSGVHEGNRIVANFDGAATTPANTFIALLCHDAPAALALASIYRVVSADATGVRLDRIYSGASFTRHCTIFAMASPNERPYLRVRRSVGEVPSPSGTLTPTASGVTIDPKAMGAWRFVVEYNDAGETMMSLQVRARVPNTSGAAEYERYWKTVTSWSENNV